MRSLPASSSASVPGSVPPAIARGSAPGGLKNQPRAAIVKRPSLVDGTPPTAAVDARRSSELIAEPISVYLDGPKTAPCPNGSTCYVDDDDPSVLDLTEAFLERELASVAVTSVTEPSAAADALDEGEFDCVVSDYDMPGMDGLELFEAVHAAHRRLPFVLYTGKGSEEIASQALNAGVTGYF